MQQPNCLILSVLGAEPRWEGIATRRHDTNLNHEHDNKSSKGPLPRKATLLSESENISHNTPCYVKDTQLHKEGGFIESFVGIDTLLTELIVHFSKLHIHEDIVGFFDTVEFVRGGGVVGVLVGVELEGELFVGTFDVER